MFSILADALDPSTARIKDLITKHHSEYLHCSLRDAISFTDNPMTELDWYTALIAVQASRAVYGQAACSPGVDKTNNQFYPILEQGKYITPPLDSLQKEYLGTLEDLCALFETHRPTKNLFLDNSKSDLQAWYCELETSLSSVIDVKTMSHATPSARLEQSILSKVSKHAEELDRDCKQVILAFRGTKGLSDVLTDAHGLKVPMKWVGKTGAPMAEEYAGISAQDVADRIRNAHTFEGIHSRTRFARACSAVLKDGGDAAVKFATLLDDAMVHQGFMEMYQVAPSFVFERRRQEEVEEWRLSLCWRRGQRTGRKSGRVA